MQPGIELVKHSPKFKNVLFATDFSDFSQAAAPFARAIAQHYDCTLHIVHVLPAEPHLSVPMDQFSQLDVNRIHAEEDLEKFVAANDFTNDKWHWSVQQGPVWEVLSEIIERLSIDLIVLGTRGRSGLKKLVLGSVAEEVFRLSPCPVLTVGPEVKKGTSPTAAFHSILHATDFSADSARALPYALSLANENPAGLTVLHVAEDKDTTTHSALRDEFVAMLPEALQLAPPMFIVEAGPTAQTILEVARREHVDLIVLGAHAAASSLTAAHFPGSVASMVVSHAPCPVLTVRG